MQNPGIDNLKGIFNTIIRNRGMQFILGSIVLALIIIVISLSVGAKEINSDNELDDLSSKDGIVEDSSQEDQHTLNSGVKQPITVADRNPVVESNVDDGATVTDTLDAINSLVITNSSSADEDQNNAGEKITTSLGLTINNSELQDIAILSDYNELYQINRLQLSDLVYKILQGINAIPDIQDHQINYTDIEDIPSESITAVRIISYLKLFNTEEEFGPYKIVRINELNDIVVKLQAYIDSMEVTGDVDTEGEEDKNEADSQIEEEAANILANRVPEDKLNGTSAAIFTQPKSLSEIEANLNAVDPLDILTDFKPTTYVDWLNIDEAIIDKSMLEELIVVDPDTIQALTVSEDIKFEIQRDSRSAILLNDKLLNKTTLIGRVIASDVLLMKDNSIIQLGTIIYDLAISKRVFIHIPSLDDIDSVGIIVSKSVVDGSDSSDKIVIKIPLE